MTSGEGGLAPAPVPLAVIGREWLRLGCLGFGGPPTHISMLRNLCVARRAWMSAEEFEDANATTALLPGPASTQLAIFCAWRLRGAVGAVVGGLCFIVPGLVLILALSALFLSAHPPSWVVGAAAGAGAAVPAVALHAARGLIPTSWRRAGERPGPRLRWVAYALAGGAAAATIGPFLVVVLAACGILEIAIRHGPRPTALGALPLVPAALLRGTAAGGNAALAWVAIKVGALSYGGGFIIIPLMQHDAVTTYHWLSGTQFLNAVALGQITPGPVVQTVSVVGYAAGGVAGGLLAAVVAFAPSFAFVLAGGRHLDRIRRNDAVQSFLAGAGPAVIGAIAGSAIPLGLAFTQVWQIPVLAAALVWLLALRRGVVVALLAAALVGVLATLAGAPT